MQNTTAIVLSQSGAALVVGNELRDAASLAVSYTITGNPLSMTITVSGQKKAAGEIAVLDSYVGTASTTRTVNLTDTYDSFRFVATWSGGGQSVSVAASVTAIGSGPTFDKTLLPSVQNYPVA